MSGVGYRFEVPGFRPACIGDISSSTWPDDSDTLGAMDTQGSPSKKIRSHRDLFVWQKSMDYVDFIYDLADRLPKEERFGLWSQTTRAAVSVVTNITEGHARFTREDFAYFLVLARSSLMETDTLLEVCLRRRYITEAEALAGQRRIAEISKMLTSLRRRLLGDWRKQNDVAA